MGSGTSRVRLAIVPQVGPAPDTLRVPVDAIELGCVRWRGPVGAPVVVAVHGITANAWSFASVEVIRDPRGDGLWVFPMRARFADEDNDWVQFTLAPASERTIGWAVDMKYRMLRFGVEQNSRYDFTTRDNTESSPPALIPKTIGRLRKNPQSGRSFHRFGRRTLPAITMASTRSPRSVATIRPI